MSQMQKEIEDNSLKCSFCGAKGGHCAKECGIIIQLQLQPVVLAEKILLKICTECKAANLPEKKSAENAVLNL